LAISQTVYNCIYYLFIYLFILTNEETDIWKSFSFGQPQNNIIIILEVVSWKNVLYCSRSYNVQKHH